MGIDKSLTSKFISVSEYCPQIIIEPRYATVHNFTGEKVEGYLQPKIVLSQEVAQAICKVDKELSESGLGLKIFDGYRPQKAVYFFKAWSQKKEENLELKKIYYPNHTKSELFDLGYISERSSHSRGGALDLTIIDRNSGLELDMGTVFDFFDQKSHTAFPGITEKQKKNRNLLISIMSKYGFKNYSKEWWHFSLENEPYPESYFDFNID